MTDTLARLTAALSDRYRPERELGAGGMATVYLAHDLRHDREVAIKVLHPDLGAALGGERFLGEIRTTARLQHPHILPLLDSGEADKLLFYVMPYIRGETLRDRLERETQLPIADALRIAGEIAGALTEAHGQGIVHRDIKPENILLSGAHALVADFGIALAVQQAGGARMTQTGLSLGTPQYMAPEQAMGDKHVDHRADQYALAAVTYEMLTGEPPHTGTNAQAIVAKLLTEPVRSATVLRPSVPAHVDAALRSALQKLPADRFADVDAFMSAMREGRDSMQLTAASIGTNSGGASTKRGISRGALFAVAGMSLLFGALIGWGVTRDANVPEAPRLAFAFQLPTTSAFGGDIVISADGQHVMRSVRDSLGVRRTALRSLADTAARLIAGTEGSFASAFSPDAQSIVFVGGDNALRRVPVAGGPSTRLAERAHSVGPVWGSDGYVYFSRTTSPQGLSRVPAEGGAEQIVSTVDSARQEFAHWSPQLLPDGKHVVYHSFAAPAESSRVEAVEIATGVRTAIVSNATNPRVTSSGHLLFVRDGALLAAPFDQKALRITRAPVPVVEDVASAMTAGTAAYDVSPGGTLVFARSSETLKQTRIQWVRRDGTRDETIVPPGPWLEPRVSPNGDFIALTRAAGKFEVWAYDVARGLLTPLSRAKGTAFSPVWLPDGRGVVHAVETPVYDIGVSWLDGRPPDTLLLTDKDKLPTSVSPDGLTIAYTRIYDGETIMLAPRSGGEGEPLGSRERSQNGASFSPDGAWIAWSELDPDSRAQIFVRKLDGTVRRVQVSAEGGSQPRWTKGGREVVYRRGDDVLAAEFDLTTGRVGKPLLLFSVPDDATLVRETVDYDVTPDGQRFLMAIPEDRKGSLPYVVITNWLSELRERVPR